MHSCMVNHLKVGLDWRWSILWAKFVMKTNGKKKKRRKKRSTYFSLFKRVRLKTFECLHEHEYYVLCLWIYQVTRTFRVSYQGMTSWPFYLNNKLMWKTLQKAFVSCMKVGWRFCMDFNILTSRWQELLVAKHLREMK